MSLEAWGDDDGAGDYDHLLEAGWWTTEQAEEVTAAIKALRTEQLYEDGEKAKGVSTRFLMRLTVLSAAAGILEEKDPLVVEARTVLDGQTKET